MALMKSLGIHPLTQQAKVEPVGPAWTMRLGHDCAPLSGGLFAEAVRRGNQRQYLLWPAWSETALMEV